MKKLIKEYINLISLTLCFIVLGLGFYLLIINAYHFNNLKKDVYVNTLDNSIVSYQNNVKELENNILELKRIDINNKNIIPLNRCHEALIKDSPLNNLKTGDILKYYDIYKLNEDYLNVVVNKCYVLGLVDYSTLNNDFSKIILRYKNSILTLNDVSRYLKEELNDNGSYYYNTDISNSGIRNNLYSSYKRVLNNYSDFSSIILSISKDLVESDKNA